MEDTIRLIENIITASVFAFVVTAAVGFALFFFGANADLKKRFRAVMPIYYMFLAFMLFCALLLSAFGHFEIEPIEIVALAAWIYALVSAIKAYKLSKGQDRARFKSFTTKKYLADIIICFFLYFLWVGGVI
ncbi:MAG: hypothetical protein LBQ18_04125 [Campylobacteraceae bacterium]|nr:hypothetical protein [Campylobacteraceae bacterium]